MPVENLVVFVEEPSMEAALELLLPKILRAGIRFDVKQFQCKDELLNRLPQRLKAYAGWMPATWRLLVLVDRDDDDCIALKQRLEGMARTAGLTPLRGKVQVINRIAIEELEAWFFGDWTAVVQAYSRMQPNTWQKAAYRQPDAIAGGTWEALAREMRKRGYFASGLPKIEFARSVAQHMNPSSNRPPSFCAMRDALQEL